MNEYMSMLPSRVALALAGSLLASGGTVVLAQDDAGGPAIPPDQTARAAIVSCDDVTDRFGTAYLRERPTGEGVKIVDVTMAVYRVLPPGKHAVHIHETAMCAPCSAAGGHFDPGPMSDTSPDGNHPYHAGDLVNIDVDDRRIGTLFTTTTRVTLSDGPLSLFDGDGSAFIIHVDPDSYCPDGEEAGCAGGARAGCGIIRRDG